MKKIVIALIVSAMLLSGCGLFHSSKPWKDAKQENPLEIPPRMDRPSVSDALSIPRVNAQQASSTASRPSASSLHMDSDVDSVYKRVGLVLGSGDIGSVAAQDPGTHTYRVALQSKLNLDSSKSFMQKHFNNAPESSNGGNASSGNAGKPAQMVTVRVTPDSDGGSTVSAQGAPEQVTRVMGALKARLGG